MKLTTVIGWLMRNWRRLAVGLGILLGFWFWVLWWRPPTDFSGPLTVTVAEGATVAATAEELERAAVIRSPTLFTLLTRGLVNADRVIAGDYFFYGPVNVYRVAKRLARGEFDLDLVKVTVPEGLSNRELANLLELKFPALAIKEFLSLAAPLEGYLFPDTYFFPPRVSAKHIVKTMNKNFTARLAPLAGAVAASGRDFSAVVTMASLLEKEARTMETRRTIADILWKRLDDDMLLQVDAVFPYLIGKNTFQLTTKDLQIDSPYNTYRYRGLPSGPIANPGLAAIEAALDPQPSPYWFYLSDLSGRMHYAVDFSDHQTNKQRYLE